MDCVMFLLHCCTSRLSDAAAYQKQACKPFHHRPHNAEPIYPSVSIRLNVGANSRELHETRRRRVLAPQRFFAYQHVHLLTKKGRRPTSTGSLAVGVRGLHSSAGCVRSVSRTKTALKITTWYCCRSTVMSMQPDRFPQLRDDSCELGCSFILFGFTQQ